MRDAMRQGVSGKFARTRNRLKDEQVIYSNNDGATTYRAQQAERAARLQHYEQQVAAGQPIAYLPHDQRQTG